MLNKPFSHLLLIRMRHKALKFIFPVPLFVFADILQSAADLVALGGSFFPQLKLPGMLITQTGNLLLELRWLGNWTLVDITAGEIKISVTFY